VPKSENPLALVGTMYLLPWLARLTTKHMKSTKQLRVNPMRGGRQQPHQSLEKFIKYIGKVPPNGGIILPENVHV
jgi:hypothetical protein